MNPAHAASRGDCFLQATSQIQRNIRAMKGNNTSDLGVKMAIAGIVGQSAAPIHAEELELVSRSNPYSGMTASDAESITSSVASHRTRRSNGSSGLGTWRLCPFAAITSRASRKDPGCVKSRNEHKFDDLSHTAIKP